MRMFPRMKDSNIKAHVDSMSYERQKIHEEGLKMQTQQERDNMKGFYEAELRHYEKQKKMLLEQLENEKNPYTISTLQKSLKYNKINTDRTLLLIKQRDNVK